MAKAVHLYPIPAGDAFTCNLPAGAVVVRAEYAMAQTAGGIVGPDQLPRSPAPTLMLFVLFDVDALAREYSFKVVQDDCPVDDMEYRVSAYSPEGGFFHVFQSA